MTTPNKDQRIQYLIDQLIRREGGYVNDPSDSGGETNYGITVAVARDHGYEGAMADLPRSVAEAIHTKDYWTDAGLDAVSVLDWRTAEKLFDAGVNCGVRRAGKWLQRSLNVLNDRGQLFNDVTVDGEVGPKTVKALTRYLDLRSQRGSLILGRMLNSLQGTHYIELAERREKDERFIFGWFFNRIG